MGVMVQVKSCVSKIVTNLMRISIMKIVVAAGTSFITLETCSYLVLVDKNKCLSTFNTIDAVYYDSSHSDSRSSHPCLIVLLKATSI